MSNTNPATRLRNLQQQALAESRFDALVARIAAFRAYALALRDTGVTDALDAFDTLDAELIEHFQAASGSPEGLDAFLDLE
ncbi:MAG: hypothetical protein BGP25_05235 [Lysobacterales bacterium 63-13]|nr:MAG: hypothetical protein BGP25_05235 [Xanthomonadales bacterium 63-13]